MHFLENKEDRTSFIQTNTLFQNLSKHLIFTNGLIKDNNTKFIKIIDESLSSYYHYLYIETVNSLLDYSDCYYRFIKNQYLGIKFISKLNE